MKFELPELPYPENALAPYISSETIQYHYGKHTKKYYETVDKLIKDTAFEKYDTLQDLIEKGLVRADSQLFNNACQAWNHTFYWESLTSSNESSKPSPELEKAINKQFGSFEKFKDKFIEISSEGFGSYWTWLIVHQGDLKIKNMPNAGCPLTTKGQLPLFVVDNWEHAWYVDFPADKPEYIKTIWNIINWDVINERFKAA